MDQMQKLELNEEKWVHDSSVDHKGRVPLRASTGAWKASLFIIGIEFGERLTYFGMIASLIIYLTKVLHQDLKSAAKNVNYWTGVTTIMPLLGGFLADAYLGRFFTVLASSIIYVMALLLLTMSRVIPSLQPCNIENCQEPRTIHKIIFFLAIYLISTGTGGYRPCLESFGADQFDEDHPQERVQKMSFFNWWNFGLCCGMLLGVTIIVYIQDHVGWAASYIVLTVVMTLTVIMFCLGRPMYRFRRPNRSPFTPMLQVLVAAFSKRNLSCAADSDELYEVKESDKTQGGRRLVHTDKLRFLDKAAIMKDPSDKQNPWKLATVTKVEETKLIINTIPIWLTSLAFGMCATQPYTFFTKQSTALNRKLSHDFTIPPASVSALSAIALTTSILIYDKFLVPFLRKITGNERGISILHRIGIGMVFSILTMVVAALVEKKRLTVVESNPLKGSISMSVFWLAPQFVLIAIADTFTLVGLQEYFYDQVPDSMRSLGIAFYLSVIGVSNFVSSLLITLVDHATERFGGKSWFGKDLNSSRLDYFYWLLAVIMGLNLCMYVFVARRYEYKNVRNVKGAVADCYEGDGGESIA